MDNREQRAINKAKENPHLFLFFLSMSTEAKLAMRRRMAALSDAGYKDYHTVTAAAAFEIKPEEVTKPQRAAAKNFNFWDLYSMGSDPARIAQAVLGNRAPCSPSGRLTSSRPNLQDMRPENERLAEIL